MRSVRLSVIAVGSVALATVPAWAADPMPGIRAHLKPVAYRVPVGKPVWVTFSVENTSHDPITLTVPNTEPQIPSAEMGLPLSHVFSGGSSSGVMVTTESGRQWEKPVGYKSPAEAPILILGPFSSVGQTLDLRDFYPALHVAGEYRVTWQPYAAIAGPSSVVINIAPRRRVLIETDEGRMTMELYYEDAPNHVANFLDLVTAGFYGGKTFHRIVPGYMIQGGCSRGDGTGIRPDGKRVAAEFNDRIHEKGTVSMALLDDDPDSASTQFFICNTRQKNWDGRYTVFGHLVGDESYATLDKLMSIHADDQGRPERTVSIRAARAIDAPSEPPSPVP